METKERLKRDIEKLDILLNCDFISEEYKEIIRRIRESWKRALDTMDKAV